MRHYCLSYIPQLSEKRSSLQDFIELNFNRLNPGGKRFVPFPLPFSVLGPPVEFVVMSLAVGRSVSGLYVLLIFHHHLRVIQRLCLGIPLALIRFTQETQGAVRSLLPIFQIQYSPFFSKCQWLTVVRCPPKIPQTVSGRHFFSDRQCLSWT